MWLLLESLRTVQCMPKGNFPFFNWTKKGVFFKINMTVQFSPLTIWVRGGTWGTIQQWSPISFFFVCVCFVVVFCRRPSWAVLVQMSKSGCLCQCCFVLFLGPFKNQVEVTLQYPDIAVDQYGNLGFWTIIYNQVLFYSPLLALCSSTVLATNMNLNCSFLYVVTSASSPKLMKEGWKKSCFVLFRFWLPFFSGMRCTVSLHACGPLHMYSAFVWLIIITVVIMCSFLCHLYFE